VKVLVTFDCDSTLTTVEGVDELAWRAGVGEQIENMTRAAMEGRIPLEEVYGRRLDLIRPGRQDLEWLGRRYIETMTPGARQTVAALQAVGVDIHVISGGLLPAVAALATTLGISQHQVHAVGIRFSSNGEYEGYQEDSPLARAGGKGEVVSTLAGPGVFATMVGDGMTDLEASAAGAVTIGFGGVKARSAVKEGADYFVPGPSLEPVVEIVSRLTGS
jgi:phosphoserine phosphatase